MTETQEQAVAVLNRFFQQLKKDKDMAQIEAQQLINLFRQLDVIGLEHLPAFNDKLLHASDEVQLNLTGLMGGTAVRSYLDFLKAQRGEKVKTSGDENEGPTLPAHSYLPSPEDIPVVGPVSDTAGGAGVSVEALAQLQQQSQKNTNEVLQTVIKEQMTVLNDSLKQVLQKMADISERQIQEMKNMSAGKGGAVYREIEEYPQSVSTPNYTPRATPPSFTRSSNGPTVSKPKEDAPVHQIEITETT